MSKLLRAWASLWTGALLAVVYFLVLGPVCALARALGWDPLALDRAREVSFWRRRDSEDSVRCDAAY